MKKTFIAKYLLYIILFFITFAVLAGCSSSKENMDSKTLTGLVQVIGNEPFIKLALRNNEGVYILNCSGSIRDSLFGNQGSTAKVYFNNISTNNENQKVINVEKVEFVPSGSE